MPMYDYRCKSCGHKFTVFTGISDRHRVICPECKDGKVEQLITGCSIRTGGGCSPAEGSSGSHGFGGG